MLNVFVSFVWETIHILKRIILRLAYTRMSHEGGLIGEASALQYLQRSVPADCFCCKNEQLLISKLLSLTPPLPVLSSDEKRRRLWSPVDVDIIATELGHLQK